jgi:hypothetical protein
VAWVVKARHVKGMPSRKTDVVDAQWLEWFRFNQQRNRGRQGRSKTDLKVILHVLAKRASVCPGFARSGADGARLAARGRAALWREPVVCLPGARSAITCRCA